MAGLEIEDNGAEQKATTPIVRLLLPVRRRDFLLDLHQNISVMWTEVAISGYHHKKSG
jgi:hypothetical protein